MFEVLHLPAGHGLAAGSITVEPGTSKEQGNVVVYCPAGGEACVLNVNADGSASYEKTGGMPAVELSQSDKWQGVVYGSPTLELSESESLDLVNKVERRTTHHIVGARYNQAGEGEAQLNQAGEVITAYDDRYWRKLDPLDTEPSQVGFVPDYWIPEGLRFSAVLEHNGVKMFKSEGVDVLLHPTFEGDVLLSQGSISVQEGYHGYLEYGTFGVLRGLLCSIEDSCSESSQGAGWSLSTRSYSYGQYPGANPTGMGSATWTGVMTGLDVKRFEPDDAIGWLFGGVRLDETTRWLFGDARIDIDDLSNPDVDVSFTGVRDVKAGTARPDMAWNDLSLTNGAFNDGQTISGMFSGPTQQEVGGVFDRDGITGAFGAKRQ